MMKPDNETPTHLHILNYPMVLAQTKAATTPHGATGHFLIPTNLPPGPCDRPERFTACLRGGSGLRPRSGLAWSPVCVSLRGSEQIRDSYTFKPGSENESLCTDRINIESKFRRQYFLILTSRNDLLQNSGLFCSNHFDHQNLKTREIYYALFCCERTLFLLLH